MIAYISISNPCNRILFFDHSQAISLQNDIRLQKESHEILFPKILSCLLTLSNITDCCIESEFKYELERLGDYLKEHIQGMKITKFLLIGEYREQRGNEIRG